MATTSFALVLHGGSKPGQYSDPRIKTITRAGEFLLFSQARKYFADGKGPEYASVNFDNFEGLSDADYRALFDKSTPAFQASKVIYDTGLYVGKDVGGMKIYACRNEDTTLTYQDIKNLLPRDGRGRIVLVCCQDYAQSIVLKALASGSWIEPDTR